MRDREGQGGHFAHGQSLIGRVGVARMLHGRHLKVDSQGHEEMETTGGGEGREFGMKNCFDLRLDSSDILNSISRRIMFVIKTGIGFIMLVLFNN